MGAFSVGLPGRVKAAYERGEAAAVDRRPVFFGESGVRVGVKHRYGHVDFLRDDIDGILLGFLVSIHDGNNVEID